MNHDDVTRLLDAYLDGELDLTACVEFEDHVAGCESCQRKVTEQQELIEVIRSEAPRFEAPPFLKTRIRAALREESGPVAAPFWKGMFARWLYAGMAVGVAVILAFTFSSPRRIPALVQEAVANHVRALQVNHLMDVASTDQHTVKPWFAGKLDYSPQVVDLAPSGFPLIGGRLDVLDNRNVAALIYQRRKHYINLFIWPSAGQQLPRDMFVDNGYHVLGWTSGGMNYMAVSEVAEKEFRDFVQMIQEQTGGTQP
jgi:anti-sigma factor RsiW